MHVRSGPGEGRVHAAVVLTPALGLQSLAPTCCRPYRPARRLTAGKRRGLALPDWSAASRTAPEPGPREGRPRRIQLVAFGHGTAGLTRRRGSSVRARRCRSPGTAGRAGRRVHAQSHAWRHSARMLPGASRGVCDPEVGKTAGVVVDAAPERPRSSAAWVAELNAGSGREAEAIVPSIARGRPLMLGALRPHLPDQPAVSPAR